MNFTTDDHGEDAADIEEMEYVIKLRGCPWSTTEDDIIDFFGPGVQILGDRDGIHLVKTPEGRATGEAFLEPLTTRDLELGLAKDRSNMGHRYIEVFKVKKVEMDWILKRSRPNETPGAYNGSGGGTNFRGTGSGGGGSGGYSSPNEFETFVRLRGLPYECTEGDILEFFNGLDVSKIHMLSEAGGEKFSGEAYVQFSTVEEALESLSRDRGTIGHRYVEIFRATNTEIRNAMDQFVHRNNRGNSYGNRPGPYDRPSNRDARPSMGRQPMQRGMSSRGSAMPNRYFSSNNSGNGGTGRFGGGQANWNNYANEVGSWNQGGGGGRGGHSRPQPLLPGLKSHGNSRMAGTGEFTLLLRGLPWSATEADISNFFAPINIRGVQIIFDETDRPSGSARAFFASADDQTCALRKHKNLMGSRYVELFVE